MGMALGLGRYWDWRSVEEFQEGMVRAYNAKHPQRAIDLARLRRDGFVTFPDSGPIYRAGHGLGGGGCGLAGQELVFPRFDGEAGSNRIQLFSRELAELHKEKVETGEDPTGHEPLPTYYRQLAPPPGHVRLVYGRSPVHSFARTQNTPVLFGREAENTVWVAPPVARAFGIENAEYVDVINQDGFRSGPVRLKVTPRIREDAVFMTHGHGRNSRQLSRAWKKGADDSALITRYNLDPLSGGTAMRVNFVRLVRPHAV
jgi:thiosulfate reductase/polysulfide reductase chain A